MIQTTAQEPKLFIGIDIHKKSWKVHFRTDLFNGRSLTMPPRADELKKYVAKHFSDHQVYSAYEAGCCGYAAHRSFKTYGWNSIVVNPADIPKAQKQASQKTDKIDAVNISRQLRDGQLRGIYIPNKEQEQLRSLFRRRDELVKDLRRIKSKIKSQLLYFGIDLPAEYDNSYWSKDMVAWIESQTWQYTTGWATTSSRINYYKYVESEMRAVSVLIRAYCRKHYKKDYYLMRSVPGVGPIVAAGILSELGDIRRFNAKEFAGYIGLVPGIYQSGENTRTSGMTFRAHRLMRSYMIEASWQAIRFDPVMQTYYRKHYGKDVTKIIVKVAHKLANRILAVVKSGVEYQIGIVA